MARGGGEVSQLCLNSPRLKDNNYTVFGGENNEFCNFAYVQFPFKYKIFIYYTCI